MRLQKPKLYTDTLARFSGKDSLAIDEIEKDLNRSLPEYPGFQSEEGIGRLRRVLTAYSWTNEEVGYCQAMNIVVAALLMYESPASISSNAWLTLSDICPKSRPFFFSQSCVIDCYRDTTLLPCTGPSWINVFLNLWSRRPCLSCGII